MAETRLDFQRSFELAAILATYWHGALPWEKLEHMTIRQMLWYYRLYERQQAEEEVKNGFLCPKKGEPKPLPPPARLRALVDKKLEEWHS